MRHHRSLPDIEPATKHSAAEGNKQLWGWVQQDEAARAFLLAVTSEIEDFQGHETFLIVAPETATKETSAELAKRVWPEVKLKRELKGQEGFFDCTKAKRLLGWTHKSY